MATKRLRTSEASDPVGSLDSCQKMLAAVCAGSLTGGFKSIGTIGTNLEKIEQRIKGAILSLEAQLHEHSQMIDTHQAKEVTLEGDHKSGQEHTAARGIDVGEAKKRLDEAMAAKRAASAALQKAEGLLAAAEQEKKLYEDLYQLRFLPLMKGEFSGLEASKHIDALRTALQRWGCEDCLLAGFVESARHPPSERQEFCTRIMAGVDQFFQQPLQDVNGKWSAAKEVVDAAIRDLRAAEAHCAECEALYKQALDAHQGAKDMEAKILDDLNGTRKDKSAAIFSHKDTQRKLDAQKSQLDAFYRLCYKIEELAKLCYELEMKLVGAKESHASIELRMAEINLQQYKDVTAMKGKLVAEAKKALDLANKERMMVQQSVSAAEGKVRQAEAEKSYRADLYNNRFLALLNGKFANVTEANSHLQVLVPVLQKWEMEVCLLAAFGEAGKKYPADRRDWCVETMKCVGDFFQPPLQDADSKWMLTKEELEARRSELVAADEAVARAEAEYKSAMEELQVARRAEEEAMKGLAAIEAELRVAITLVKDITFQLQGKLKELAVYGDRLEAVETQGGDWVSVLRL